MSVMINGKTVEALTLEDCQFPMTFSLPNMETCRVFDLTALANLAEISFRASRLVVEGQQNGI